MRHVHGRVAAGAVLVGALGLSACSNQPNDLRSYADEESTPPSSSASATPNRTTAAPPPREQADRLRPEVHAALLTDQDVAAEGVHRAPPEAPQGPDPVRDCVRRAAPAAAELVRADARWRYETGSALRHSVAAYPAGEAVRLARQARSCGLRQLDVRIPQGVRAAAAWCVPGTPDATCAVLLAGGRRVSTLTVSGTTEQRAEEAVLRLAPLAANRLGPPTTPGSR